jgi:hypothetical protein
MIPELVERFLTMTSHIVTETAAPMATKSGAGLVFMSSIISWVGQNVGFFSVLTLVVGCLLSGAGIYFQIKNAIAARRLAENQQRLAEDTIARERELHELRKAALLRQVKE